jgi:outer membrane protein OmpA-like peptidoglycan-associated protein
MRSEQTAWTAAVLLVLLVTPSPAPCEDVAGGRDHPLLTRMPGFSIDDYEEREFDRHEFRGRDGESWSVEGRKFYIDYGLDKGERVPSELQILRNHANAIETIGGTVLFQNDSDTYLKVAREGKETWVHVRVYNQATAYSLNIIEKQAMVQEVVADAESMARDISTTGRTAVYGIYFDFDRADIKPESEAALREIAKLLGEDPRLRLHVVGHTDNVGDLDYNMRLSQRRAQAVVVALTSEYGIASGRLRPAGIGPLAPAAPNTSEEGRAKNRRVELVEQ